jgi:hypothetical protein
MALHDGSAIDFRTGHATVLLDLYAPGAGALTLTVDSALPSSGVAPSSYPRYPLLTSAAPVYVVDGQTVTLDLQWTVPAGELAAGGAAATTTIFEATVSLCKQDGQCSKTSIPVSALPGAIGSCGALGCPDGAAPDGAAPDAGVSDGG